MGPVSERVSLDSFHVPLGCVPIISWSPPKVRMVLMCCWTGKLNFDGTSKANLGPADFGSSMPFMVLWVSVVPPLLSLWAFVSLSSLMCLGVWWKGIRRWSSGGLGARAKALGVSSSLYEIKELVDTLAISVVCVSRCQNYWLIG